MNSNINSTIIFGKNSCLGVMKNPKRKIYSIYIDAEKKSLEGFLRDNQAIIQNQNLVKKIFPLKRNEFENTLRKKLKVKIHHQGMYIETEKLPEKINHQGIFIEADRKSVV